MLTDCRSAAVVVCSDVCANTLATLVKISVTAKSPLTKRFITKSLQDELYTRSSALTVRTTTIVWTCVKAGVGLTGSTTTTLRINDSARRNRRFHLPKLVRVDRLVDCGNRDDSDRMWLI